MMIKDVLFDELGQLGVITLNRSAALNALTLPMIIAIQQQLEIWKQTPRIQVIILKAEPGKAFCAGGDVRWLYESGRENRDSTKLFFWHEYRLNYYIHHLGKPYIALMDGITMGGGVGVALHGSHPIASPNFSFAMPETTIGFFPDIGASHLLTHCPYNMGIYLGLTGDRLSAQDALTVGLVKGIVASEAMPLIIQSLAVMDLTNAPFRQVDACLKGFALPTEMNSTSSINPLIARCFAHSTVEAILDSLNETDTDWSRAIVRNLHQKSPLSLKITLAQLLKAQGLSLKACLNMDFNLVNHFINDHDFYEGVRALLIDKDKSPKWQPAELSLVTEAMVNAYFVPCRDALGL